ncbi:hypothetical protein N473_25925 [Pseudoalteromonas luteoviolacea CPMOR-1]|uniref:Uncharacterized protein n=1 Tax=Pseudoalteromonas luteoviolacea CPMOR-1 TaxID=1365248 RepID=A0A167IIK4_9GAMM|nr:hypothetical protein [Pseudoalteromonas luteoviolacea]KZN59575.1 hypothetical protein N473_25925 [Pseudoalteromonas luteoviolacea CPMOR-1]
MSDIIREVIATVLFIIALVASYILFSGVFNLLFCALIPICFLSAYLIWPRRENQGKDMIVLDVIYTIISFPVDCVVRVSRLLYRLLGFMAGGKDGGGFD